MGTLTKKERVQATTVPPGSFEAYQHWYPKAFNAAIHPMVNFFLNLSQARIISRFIHLHPQVNKDTLRDLLNYKPQYFQWAGTDLLNATTAGGRRQMVVIENNSCPSGQKSMPLTDDHQEQGNYRWLIEKTFKPFLEERIGNTKGSLAMIYDKNHMEASGYAAVIADVFDEPVYFVTWHFNDEAPAVRIRQRQLHVRDKQGNWQPIRAVFRYLTQKPWNRLPLCSKTVIFNPVVACLAGGRNKMLADKAYYYFNEEYKESGLQIFTPETIRDVSKEDIPVIVEKMGGHAVVKVPYSNAGQGVFTIVSKAELDRFMAMEFDYDCFIVQSLIGNYSWSSVSEKGKLFHVGTIPTKTGDTYVADLRMMIHYTQQGIRPLCIYARRANKPLANVLDEDADSWSMLGTNLSIKKSATSWDSETSRLILMDRRDFNRLGIGIDDLIEAYIQSAMSVIAIDKMACKLMFGDQFNFDIFEKLNDDKRLLNEILKAG